MGSSTIQLQRIVDSVAASGIPVPQNGPSGYGTNLAVDLANEVMQDIIAERFNWKWNRITGLPFYTNSYQQDYPMIGLDTIGWGEIANRLDVNNTAMPKPLKSMSFRRDLPSWNQGAAGAFSPPTRICWEYNKDLLKGTWPGPNAAFSPQVTPAPILPNPFNNFIDANGNLLVLTTPGPTGSGVTGSTAPSLPPDSAEGTTVADGSCIWTVADELSQGYRILPIVGGNGPVYRITPIYQAKAVMFVNLQQKLDPIPDDQMRTFKRGYRTYCLRDSGNPNMSAQFPNERMAWHGEMADLAKQGDREQDEYGLLPISSPVESVYGWIRNPQDVDQPY